LKVIYVLVCFSLLYYNLTNQLTNKLTTLKYFLLLTKGQYFRMHFYKCVSEIKKWTLCTVIQNELNTCSSETTHHDTK